MKINRELTVKCPYCGHLIDVSTESMSDGWNIVICPTERSYTGRGCGYSLAVHIEVAITTATARLTESYHISPDVPDDMRDAIPEQLFTFLKQAEFELTLYTDYLEIPSNAGVYLLWRNDDHGLDYIGETMNVRNRLGRKHPVYKRGDYLIGFIPVAKDKTRADLEFILIERLHPARNVYIVQDGEPVAGTNGNGKNQAA